MQYQCKANLNIYDSPQCHSLATQAAKGRYLTIIEPVEGNKKGDRSAVMVHLREDDYPGWLINSDLDKIESANTDCNFPILSVEEIKNRLPEAIAFTYQAMNVPNYYLWGGTVGPNYDCSGLMQAAFANAGIWIPRDAYQQEAFTEGINTESINLDKRDNLLYVIEPGDLIFFGPPEKATHVGLYLGDGRYIHSSGKDEGRNGIGIDLLSETADEVSRRYYCQLRGAGRIIKSYQPS